MENTVKELNEFLKGHYMAIHGYESLIQHIDNDEVKNAFQSIQQNHKEHASKVAERIQDIGGEPLDGVGVVGSIVETFNNFKDAKMTDEDLINKACEAEDRGIAMSEEVVRGDLDNESLQLIKSILTEDRLHVSELHKLKERH
ncbi:DUF2383 domain-containing protein [Bacillus sp. HMF5848]|uniref:DUF2383 domain-containing protein n=1 Tax=Bacillus sp. HMF5848 TaxID=2495421 RepID=UPI000F786AE3|nr:DUF2383 domain-containing protein [Bacillus sp. HMF5848]RSK27346.1 DUF2383 domain-containing protein [Bacillus sp. HMF5848]